jgi:hypothetical protein
VFYELDLPMTTPYTVRLVGAGILPVAARIAAEVRFLTELERILGGQNGVIRAWGEGSALEQPGLIVPPETPQMTTTWDEAFRAASVVAAGEAPGAAFRFQVYADVNP